MQHKEIAVEDAKPKLGDIVLAAAREQQVTLITRYGAPVAYIVSIDMMRQMTAAITEPAGAAA